jgi:5-methylcytosine-specific restriction endonuclease McrA
LAIKRLWFYKNCKFDPQSIEDVSDEEISLLIMDVFDAERRHFEHLKARFDGIKNGTHRRPPIPESIRIHVWQRDGGQCIQCGSREKLEYDHIIPISKGGSSTARNLQLLCEPCNRSKSDRIA